VSIRIREDTKTSTEAREGDASEGELHASRTSTREGKGREGRGRARRVWVPPWADIPRILQVNISDCDFDEGKEREERSRASQGRV
jgi:hypothetical protein